MASFLSTQQIPGAAAAGSAVKNLVSSIPVSKRAAGIADVVKTNALESIPAFAKISFLVLFYIFFYKIFFDMGVFFGIDEVPLMLYMTWFGVLFLFIAFIPGRRTMIEN